jgi:flagellar protein FlaG
MMEIRIVVPTTTAPSGSTVPKPPQPDQKVLGANTDKALQKEVQAEATVKASPKPKAAPLVPKIRAELRYDETINRVIGRVYNETTGEAIRELPPEEIRQLYAKTREMLGPLVDEKA